MVRDVNQELLRVAGIVASGRVTPPSPEEVIRFLEGELERGNTRVIALPLEWVSYNGLLARDAQDDARLAQRLQDAIRGHADRWFWK